MTIFERMIGGGGRVWPVPVEDPFTNAHAENESLNIPDFASTVRSFVALFKFMAESNRDALFTRGKAVGEY